MTERAGEPQGPLTEVLAIVDSGAYRTSLPLAVAVDLGLNPDDLVEDPHGGMGVGSHFRVWMPGGTHGPSGSRAHGLQRTGRAQHTPAPSRVWLNHHR